MSTRIVPQPMTAAEVLATHWPANVRSAARRDGNALRAGAGNSIEAQSINTGEWGAIMLPNGGASFTTAADRDQVLAVMHGAEGRNNEGQTIPGRTPQSK